MSGKRSFVPPAVEEPISAPGAGLRFPKFPKPGSHAGSAPSPAPAGSLQSAPQAANAPIAPQATERYEMLPLGLLVDSPYQRRILYNEDKLAELAESIKHIQVDPLLVRPLPDGKFELISGHRRRRAATLAQLESLKCQIVELSDADARITVMSANEPHEDWTDFERALGYRDVLDEGRATKGEVQTLRQLASRIGVSHTLVHRRLSMLDLPAVIIDVLQQYPNAFSSNWVEKLKTLTGSSFDEKKLHDQLVRVATGEMQMTALFSVMATSDKGKSAAGPRPALSLQKSNRVFAQITPNVAKRQITVKLPDLECDVDEVAKLLLESIQKHYGATS